MKILFVCTGNTCRSPMAEGILKSMAKERNLDIKVGSAGVSVLPGDRAARNAIKTMADLGLDISKHSSSQMNYELAEEFDLILTMSNSHRDIILSEFPQTREKTFTLMDYAYGNNGNVIDPFGGSLDMYEKTRDEIYEALEKILMKIIDSNL